MRVNVLGCEIDALTMDQTVARCDELIQTQGGFAQHMAINAAKVVKLREDDKLRDITNRCELINADGAAVVWASRLVGQPLPERVAGIDLMHRLMALAAEKGYPVFVLGAKQDVLETAVAKLREEHPALRFAGYRNGYFSDEETPALIDEIRASGAKLLFVAMSTPRKEYFLGEHGPAMGVPFVMGVGGAIDVVAGLTRRAGPTWQKLGLEWLYRLLQEPRRMFGRYARTNTAFIWLLGRELVQRKTRPA
ncbi:WecB/TagA/CpsF family glycosyltransferase [Solirubrobacter soli]|uniref:WecB/TagA/CpsF family glycosyltransferase n=1 Tax=Solirubrobacter soli TaxID=363832 RepID=UPI00042898AE|nr:WecB/TagA/CpsF family glycosyltransferase [Solirubrobacter soli]